MEVDALTPTSATPVTPDRTKCHEVHQIPRLLIALTAVRILYSMPVSKNTMSNTTRPRVFAIRTSARWYLLRVEEEEVKYAIRWAVKAFAWEIREAFRCDERDIDWVVM